MPPTAVTAAATARVSRASSMRRAGVRALLIAAALVAAAEAGAQTPAATPPPASHDGETRQGEWAGRQAAKASDLQPDERRGLERALARINAAFVSERPLHLFIGGVLDGGGIAVGPGYRQALGDTASFQAHAAWSIRGQRAIEARLDLPAVAGGRIQPWLEGAWLAAPRLALHGVGAEADVRRAVDYEHRAGVGGVRARPWRALSVAADAGVFSLTQTPADPAVPSDVVAAATYLRSRLTLDVDTRRAPRYSSRGGRYHAEVADYRGRGRHDFQRLEADVQQFVPLRRNQWTLAMRGLVTTTRTADGHSAPQVLLPSLGGDTLRGYSAWRFQDRARMLTTAEYRWAAGPHVDCAAFVDAGAVGPALGEMRRRDIRTSHGVGLILHTAAAVRARVDLARSRDGFAFQFSVSPTF